MMSRSKVNTRKPFFCYISSTQANSTYKMRSRYHPSSFIPDLATNRHIQSHLGLFRPIASHLGLFRPIAGYFAPLSLFLRISSYFVLFHHIPSYSPLFCPISSRFGTLRHSSSCSVTDINRGMEMEHLLSYRSSSTSHLSGTTLFRSHHVSLPRLATSDRGDRRPEYFLFSNPRITPEEPRFLFLAASRPPISCFAFCIHFNNVDLSTYTIAPLIPEKDTARHTRHPARRTLSFDLYPTTHMRNSFQNIPNHIPSSFLHFHLLNLLFYLNNGHLGHCTGTSVTWHYSACDLGHPLKSPMVTSPDRYILYISSTHPMILSSISTFPFISVL